MILQGKIAAVALGVVGTIIAGLVITIVVLKSELKLCQANGQSLREQIVQFRDANEANRVEMERVLEIRDANRASFDAAINAMRAIAAARTTEYHEARAEARRLESELQEALLDDPTSCNDAGLPGAADRMLFDASDALPRDRGGPRAADADR